LEESDELFTTYSKLDKLMFSCCLKIKKLLKGTDTVSPPPSDFKGVKLPKVEVPSFDGNILNWTSFWEQFCVSVHNRPTLSDPESWYTSSKPSRLDRPDMPLMVCHALARTTRKLLTALGSVMIDLA